MIVAHAFNEFSILLLLSVAVGFVAIKLRQPLILSFIIVGIIAGPDFLNWLTSTSEIEVLATFGVTLLLFIVGLKLDLNLIKSFGIVALIIGLGQIFITTVVGCLLGLMMGMPFVPALFVAIALTFSSTIIIVKVLSDRYEIDSLHGRISIGILIVQDLVVVLTIIVLSSININYADYSQLTVEIFSLILKGVGFLAVIGLLTRYLLPFVLDHIAKSRELLILFAVFWAVTLAACGDQLGFGKEIGGFLAGVSLASTKYRESIASRLEAVRNLLLLFFFLNLGTSIRFDALRSEIFLALVFSIFVLFIKPFIVMVLMGMMRFRKRTGFLTGLTLGQISEFSLILAALGMNLHYIDKNTEGLITFVGLVTIGVSTYMMAYGNFLYQWIGPWLDTFVRDVKCREDEMDIKQIGATDVIIYGFGRHGENIAKILETKGLKIMAIDFDPRKIRTWDHEHIKIRYGDAEDIEFPKSLPIVNVKWVVSTIPHFDTNEMLVTSLRELKYQGKIALSAYQESELELMKKLKVDLILVPYKDAAESAAQRLASEIIPC